MFLDKKKRDLLYLFLYVLAVYATLPFGPNIIAFLYGTVGKETTALLPFILGAIPAVAILWYLLFFKKERRPLPYLIFIVIGSCYIAGMRMLPLPAEKLHFLEYGGLAYFLVRLYPDKSSPYLSILWIFLIGFMDEVIQYILPNRFFEVHDVLTNFVGGVLGLLLMKLVIKTRSS